MSERERLELIWENKARDLFRQIKKYSDAGSTAISRDELNASLSVIYKLQNEIKILMAKIG